MWSVALFNYLNHWHKLPRFLMPKKKQPTQEIKCQPIPRITFANAQAMREYLITASGPFIATGVLDGWNIVRAWTPNYFSKRFGDLEVAAFVDLPVHGAPYDMRSEDHLLRMTLRQFVERIDKSQKASYIHQLSAAKIPDIVGETHFRSLLPPGVGNGMLYFWLGSGGTRSGLHFDRFDNLNAQVFGSKSVFIVSPDQCGRLYPFPDNVEKSRIDVDTPSFERFPALSSVRAHTATLVAGEILYIPKLWWHHFHSLSPAINVNLWYGEHISMRSILRVVAQSGVGCWIQVARDFLVCGLFGRPSRARLFSDVPTGKFLYETIATGIRRRMF